MRALICDLDGTLIDPVYAHVFAWQRAFAESGLPIDGWKIHRRIGMSGGLFARAAAREAGRPLSAEETEALQHRHGELFRELLPERRPLPGACELLRELRELQVVHGIATSGRRPEIDASLDALGVGADTVVIERGDVLRAKPEPDLFLACAERLGVGPEVIRRAVELGANFIDTADIYGNGRAEELVAEALHPYPDGLVVATKGGLRWEGDRRRDGRPEYLQQACDASLRRLRLERID